jgi:hypothetical protein
MENKLTLKELGKEMMRTVNCFTTNPKEFVDVVCNDHRTLQQEAFRLMLACIENWATVQENRYDARNESTIRLCKKMVKAIENDGVGMMI